MQLHFPRMRSMSEAPNFEHMDIGTEENGQYAFTNKIRTAELDSRQKSTRAALYKFFCPVRCSG